MVRLYIAGPLFSKAELEFNVQVDNMLNEMGYETFLPQKDCKELDVRLLNGIEEKAISEKIFALDVSNVLASDGLIFIADGRVPDEGACVELGLAFGAGKECIGLKTDLRSVMRGSDNLMISGCLKDRVAADLDSLAAIVSEVFPLK